MVPANCALFRERSGAHAIAVRSDAACDATCRRRYRLRRTRAFAVQPLGDHRVVHRLLDRVAMIAVVLREAAVVDASTAIVPAGHAPPTFGQPEKS
jgi:alkylation response protein AidB-like acyl-CoA dehydrogenase